LVNIERIAKALKISLAELFRGDLAGSAGGEGDGPYGEGSWVDSAGWCRDYAHRFVGMVESK
jgi:hypothetical protein